MSTISYTIINYNFFNVIDKYKTANPFEVKNVNFFQSSTAGGEIIGKKKQVKHVWRNNDFIMMHALVAGNMEYARELINKGYKFADNPANHLLSAMRSNQKAVVKFVVKQLEKEGQVRDISEWLQMPIEYNDKTYSLLQIAEIERHSRITNWSLYGQLMDVIEQNALDKSYTNLAQIEYYDDDFKEWVVFNQYFTRQDLPHPQEGSLKLKLNNGEELLLDYKVRDEQAYSINLKKHINKEEKQGVTPTKKG